MTNIRFLHPSLSRSGGEARAVEIRDGFIFIRWLDGDDEIECCYTKDREMVYEKKLEGWPLPPISQSLPRDQWVRIVPDNTTSGTRDGR